MAKSFGRAIKSVQAENKIKGVKVTKDIENKTHQQFANDTTILGINILNEVEQMQHILETYTKASSQRINAKILEIFS